jgi:hypothetical protein
MNSNEITGYTYGTAAVAKSPLSLDDLELLKKSVLFTGEDEKYLRMAGEVLSGQIEDVLDVWGGFVASQPHLIHYYTGPDGQPDKNYIAAARKRLGQWALDACNRPYDQDWLNYQCEIGRRHHRTKKNQTDKVQSVPNINYRYLIAFIYPFTTTMKPFLTKMGHSAEEAEKMHQAWFKSLVLHVALWSQPFVKDGDF